MTGRRATLVAVLASPADDLGALPGEVDRLEVRADLAGDLDPGPLRRAFPGPLAYTLRSVRHGGAADDPPAQRHRRLLWAARRYDLVDLEADHDLDPALLARIDPAQRRISWHGPASSLPVLQARFAAMARVPATGYLITTHAGAARDALAPLRLLRRTGRSDLTAYATGPAGTWSRLLAPWLGEPVIAGGITAHPPGGSVPVARLVADYGLPALPELRRLYGIAGGVALTTGFPRLHNAGYRRLDLPALFLPFHLPTVDAFRSGFWPEVPDGLRELGLPLGGLTVSGPLKEAALASAGRIGPAARASRSANVMIGWCGRWLADTTDAAAVTTVLRRAGVSLPGRTAVVIGCGGAGRAAAVALARDGAEVTVANRSEASGRATAGQLGLPFVPLTRMRPRGSAVVVHATPARAAPPVRLDGLDDGAVVVDFVCAPAQTPLVGAARRRGLRAIDGWAVLDAEAEQQFRLMTGRALGTGDNAD